MWRRFAARTRGLAGKGGQMASLLDRYLAGDHVAVYAELVARPDHPDADVVARELMRRVKAGAERLAAHWVEQGMALHSPVGPAYRIDETLQRIDELGGRLPTTLKAFYREV